MNIIEIIEGTADLTLQWSQKENVNGKKIYSRREHFKKFCIKKWKTLGKDDAYIHHMITQYIDIDTPIFSNMDSLDRENQRIVLEYLDWYKGGIGLPEENRQKTTRVKVYCKKSCRGAGPTPQRFTEGCYYNLQLINGELVDLDGNLVTDMAEVIEECFVITPQ